MYCMICEFFSILSLLECNLGGSPPVQTTEGRELGLAQSTVTLHSLSCQYAEAILSIVVLHCRMESVVGPHSQRTYNQLRTTSEKYYTLYLLYLDEVFLKSS